MGFSAVAIADRVGHESIDITYYTTYKTAPTEQEREEARKKYLDERGVS